MSKIKKDKFSKVFFTDRVTIIPLDGYDEDGTTYVNVFVNGVLTDTVEEYSSDHAKWVTYTDNWNWKYFLDFVNKTVYLRKRFSILNP